MATHRVSGFWDTSMSSDYFPDADDDDDVEQQSLIHEDADQEEEECDGRTPLDITIDRIGMGSYQWTLLSLCGFGWLADNMWIEAVAIILPRVQRHYDVPDNYIGTVSSSMFAGMMFGAIGWGTCSDLMGRSTAFNATLFFTSVFGLLASFANSFPTLCVLLFLLGSAVGGSMPTDGTLLLEHMPKSKQYLVTALSVFFSVGAVLAAIVGLLVIPQNSCLAGGACDPDTQNQGWKYLLTILGLITLGMFLARMVFFRLHESPRYLVHAGRPLEAIESLQLISRFNGSNLNLDIADVSDSPVDHHRPHHRPCSPPNSSATTTTSANLRPNFRENIDKPRPTSTTLFNVTGSELDPEHVPSVAASRTVSDGSATSNGSSNSNRPALVTQYNTTSESSTPLEGHVYHTPAEEHAPMLSDAPGMGRVGSSKAEENDEEGDKGDHPVPPARPRRPRVATGSSPAGRLSSVSGRRISVYEKKICWKLPRWVRKPVWAWWDRVMMVLSPEWMRTTLLVWAAWTSMSLAFTMFNVYLPKLLETGGSGNTAKQVITTVEKSLDESLWDVVIFTLGGCPGALIGAYFVESSLGRKWSLAASTFITAFFCVVFIMVESSWAVRASTVGISLSATAMWAVLYGWTPEIFGTKVRGTACGLASALSRIGGMIAPILGGVLLMMDRSIPVYTSAVVFIVAGTFVLFVPENGERSKERTVLH